MSGIVFIAPLLGFAGAVFIWFLVRIARYRCKHTWVARLGCLLPLAVFPVLTVLVFVYLPKSMTETGLGVDAATANIHLLLIDVPSTAQDVNYRHAFFSGRIDEANFHITESDLLAWATGNGWKLSKFWTDTERLHWDPTTDEDRQSDFVWVQTFTSDDFVEIANGYRFDDYDPVHLDSGFSVVYDKDNQRAYICRSTF